MDKYIIITSDMKSTDVINNFYVDDYTVIDIVAPNEELMECLTKNKCIVLTNDEYAITVIALYLDMLEKEYNIISDVYDLLEFDIQPKNTDYNKEVFKKITLTDIFKRMNYIYIKDDYILPTEKFIKKILDIRPEDHALIYINNNYLYLPKDSVNKCIVEYLKFINVEIFEMSIID